MSKKQYYEIDIIQIIKALWHRAWVVVLAAMFFGGAGFGYAAYWLPPIYKAETLMYVNNSAFSLGNTSVSISSSELTAAQSLVDTYIVILKSRSTLNAVIKDTGVDYSYEQLSNMIASSPVNSTEVFRVEVLGTDPEELELIANSIAKILPGKISDVVEGSSVRIVDYAIEPTQKISPSISKYAAVGFIAGAILCCVLIALQTLFNTQIHNEEYLMQTYDLPVLAVIPDLFQSSGGRYYKNYEAEREKVEE